MKNQKLLTRIFLTSLMLALPVTGGILTIPSNASSSEGSHSEVVSITNSSFNANTSSSYYSNDVTGWTRNFGDGRATTMIIDTEKNYSSNFSSTYRLKKDDPENPGSYIPIDNPGNVSGNNDNKILMINAALKENQTTAQAHEGYNSNKYTLDANSFYYIKVSMKTVALNASKEFGSIYIDGLKDKDGKDTSLSFEKQTASDWTDYSFFIATGESSQNISIGLWLGTKTTNSHSAVFFDQVIANKYSENIFYEMIDANNPSFSYGDACVEQTVTNHIKYIDMNQAEEIEYINHNLNFEENTVLSPEWKISSDTTKGNAQIIDTNEALDFKSLTGYEYPGSNYGYKNTKSLALWTKEKGISSVESKEIEIKSHGYYKISAQIRTSLTSGSFYLGIEEQDTIFTMYNDITELNDYYTLHSGKTSGISSTSGDFTNGYQVETLYVEAGNLYDTTAKIKLSIGNSSSNALGYAIVDNIKVEYCSKEDYTNASNKVSFAQTSASLSISNGYFNYTNNSKELTSPLSPADFTITKEFDSLKSGIINTYHTKFDADFGSAFANPANITNAPANANTSNNIFMFQNLYTGYQELKNDSVIELSESTYYNLSFDYTNYSEPLTVEIVNKDGVVLYYDDEISSQNVWSKYNALIYTGDSTQSIYVKIHFGTKDKKVSGYAFIDNLLLNTSNEAAYTSSSNKLDLSNFLLNLDPFGKVDSTLSEHTAFNGQLNSGNDGEGGVIIGNGNTSYTNQENEPIDKDEDLPNNVLVISVGEKSTYTLKSKFDVKVEADKYYKLTFKLLTNYLPKESDLPIKDKDGNTIEYNYGVSIGMTGFDKITKLQSNTKWTNYSIYFKSTESASANFEFSLISDAKNIYGTAYLTDVIWSTIDEETYTLNENSSENGKTIFTTSTSVEKENDEENDDNKDEKPATNSDFNWLLIPSLIMAAAVVIAVVGAIIRKIKIGKKQINKPTEKYDRKETLDKNVIKTEAVKQRNAEIKKLEEKIETLNKEIKELDQAHNDYIKEARNENGGKITKSIEKQFKVYASKHAKLVENLTLTKENLNSVNAPEYLISLEKKLSQQEAKSLKARNKSKN